MAYMSAYNNENQFNSCVDNAFSNLSKKQEASVLCFTRKSRFISNYYPESELKNILLTFFGNSEKIHKTGLKDQYNLLKDYVEKNNIIGLILFGANMNNIKDSNQHINYYTQINNNNVELTVTSICIVLLTEYFDYNNNQSYIDSLCKKTQNFEIYYQK